MTLERRLNELGIELHTAASAGAAYHPVVVHDNIAYVSGQLPRDGDRVLVLGQVGRDVDIAQGKHGARVAFIRVLTALRDTLGSLERVDRVLKITVFVHSASDFSAQSQIADGASQLIFDLFGQDRGGHARTSVGVAQLPRNAAVEVEATIALK